MTHKLKALYIAKELPINRVKELMPYTEVATTKETAIYKIDGSMLYIYSFGSIVFMDATPAEEKETLNILAKGGITLKANPFVDDYEVVEDKTVKGFIVTNVKVVVKNVADGMIKVVSRVLAQSVALERYEDEFDKIEDTFSKLNTELEMRGSLNMPGKGIMKMIAHNNSVFEEVVTGIGLLDKPDAAWESAFIDSLHTKLSDNFELAERFQNIQAKMEFIQENYKVFLESLRNQNDVKLEWIVIILIAVEVVLFVYELFK